MGKKKVAIMGVSSILLVAMVVGVVVGVTRKNNQGGGNGVAPADNTDLSASSKAVQQICQPADYKETCETTLSSASKNSTDPKQLIMVAFNVTMDQISEAIKNSSLLQQAVNDPKVKEALDNCRELLHFSIADLRRSFDRFNSFDISEVNEYLDDLKIWLSGAIAYQQTCLDGFQNTTGNTGEKMKEFLKLSGELTSNGLAIVSELSQIIASTNLPSSSRRLLSNDFEVAAHGFPSWLNDRRRRLLEATPATFKPNVIVAQDGSGKYKTISEALKEIPKENNNTTFVIYVKAGVYAEYVNITKQMNNVLLIGDGPTETKITGNRSFIGGVNIYSSATACIDGDHFMAKDIGFENNAGALNHQAVALRVSSDRSIFYNCQIDGHQSTLFAEAHRQFYRDCTISGTLDFIFGDAASVFQNCKLVIRKPLEEQSCMVTAQGRTDHREVTGFVLHNCTIVATPEYESVKMKFQSFLGRPWKNFSRTIVMQSQIDDVIDPTGWAPWLGTLYLDTCWYAEFSNRGPGSNTSERVTWAGIHKIDTQVASTFTPQNFINGDLWIPVTGVPYAASMLNEK